MTVVVIDYGGGGNLRCMTKALEHAVTHIGRGEPVLATRDAEDIARADWLVLPGQGAFVDCREGLKSLPGVLEALHEAVNSRGRPFLGACIGMQLMATTSYELGMHAGFNWIPGEVVRIAPEAGRNVITGADNRCIWPPGDYWWIPHYGWNDVEFDRRDHPVFSGIESSANFYFDHSYHLLPRNERHRLATADYGGLLTAAVARDNLVGTQFHPEKSQAAGLRLLANFLRWRP